MVDFRPHILKWTVQSEPQTDPETGYPVPGTDVQTFEVPCRFHSGGGSSGSKEYRNEDNTVVMQKGRIRMDAGGNMPEVGQMVTVVEGDYVHFSGPVRETYRGQKTWRVEV